MPSYDAHPSNGRGQYQFYRYREKRAGGRVSASNGTRYGASEPQQRSVNIDLIEARALLRGCLATAIATQLGVTVFTFDCVDDWLKRRGETPSSLVILSIGHIQSPSEPGDEFPRVIEHANEVPVFITSECQDPAIIVDILRCGARGYISTTMALEVCIEAIRLVRAGGTFAPPSCLVGGPSTAPEVSQRSRQPAAVLAGPVAEKFTVRQATVIDAIRRGKSNKAIAYELNMCESTVKVHVRNIMKRLNARNRTEIAFMVSKMIGHDKQPLGTKPMVSI